MPGPYIITHGRGQGAIAPYRDVRLNPSSPVAQGLRFLHLDNRNGDMLSGPHWNASLRTPYVFTNSVAMSGNRSDWISPHGTVGNYRQGFYGASTSGPEIAVTQNQWTMAGWAIYPTTDAGLRRGLYGSGGGSKHVFSTHYTTNQGILLYTGTTFSHQSATTIPHDRAFHWLVRFDVNGATNDDKIQVFIDGQRISLAHGGAPTTATQALHLGRGQQPIDQYNWNGGYWNVGGWDRWLSDAEIRYLINPVSRYDLYRGARQRTWFLSEIAGGNTFNKTSADAFVFADVDSETAAFSAAIAESIVYADTSSEVTVFVGTAADSFVITDASVAQVGIFVSVDEVFSLVDVSSEIATFAPVASESLSFADVDSELATFVRTLAETLVLADTSAGILEGIEKTAADALALADTASETAVFARTILEALTLTDSAAIATKVIGKLVLEALILTDAATAEGGVEEAATRGGSSLSRQKMRELERLQMIQRDDEEIINLIMGILK